MPAITVVRLGATASPTGLSLPLPAAAKGLVATGAGRTGDVTGGVTGVAVLEPVAGMAGPWSDAVVVVLLVDVHRGRPLVNRGVLAFDVPVPVSGNRGVFVLARAGPKVSPFPASLASQTALHTPGAVIVDWITRASVTGAHGYAASKHAADEVYVLPMR